MILYAKIAMAVSIALSLGGAVVRSEGPARGANLIHALLGIPILIVLWRL